MIPRVSPRSRLPPRRRPRGDPRWPLAPDNLGDQCAFLACPRHNSRSPFRLRAVVLKALKTRWFGALRGPRRSGGPRRPSYESLQLLLLMEPSRLPRSPAPRLVFLFATLVLTTAATALLCTAIITDHWEEVTWDKEALAKANVSPVWYLDGKVGRLEGHGGSAEKPQYGHQVIAGKNRNDPAFLVPMHGGIWTMCVSLSDVEVQLLAQLGFPQEKCINYLTPDEAHEEMRAAWQNRMQNLSISCSLVCLIIMISAALVGFFGLWKHQISAVLVTGVMYLLAAIFALFTLTIIHSKRQDRATGKLIVFDGPEDGIIGGAVDRSVLKARRFTASWSMDFGWGGVTLHALASVAWILLSKIMRFSPISVLIA